MASQDSDGESYVSHYIANPRIYGDMDPYWWSMDEEVDADLKRVESPSEEEEEETPLPQPGDMHVEFKKSSLPNKVKPSIIRFTPYHRAQGDVVLSSTTNVHPLVEDASVTNKLHKETLDLKKEVSELKEKIHTQRGIIAKRITTSPPSPKKEA
jgi:hypothetical protein